MAISAFATLALDSSSVAVAIKVFVFVKLYCSSMTNVSSLTSSSFGLTIVPAGITHVTVLKPRTLHLISVLLELSKVPCSVTVTSRSPRVMVCVSLGPVSSGVEMTPGMNAAPDANAATTPIASRMRPHERPVEVFLESSPGHTIGCVGGLGDSAKLGVSCSTSVVMFSASVYGVRRVV